jgi:hypothetical protein
MVVFRAIVDQQERASSGDTVRQEIEQGLRLSVDPMQVFKDYDHRLIETFAKDDSLNSLKGTPALYPRVHLGQWIGTVLYTEQSQ